jgi:site-specific recombinase XerD
MKKGKSAPEVQVEKIFKHTRAGSFGTRARYKDTCRNFAKFISDKFKVQNLKNVSDKHIYAFISSRQQEGIAAKTIKNDLAAIRYMHDQISNPRYELSSNQVLKEKFGLVLDKTPQVKGDRAWTEKEYKNMKDIATKMGREKAADVMTLCRSMGLRIAEATAISRAQMESALRTGVHQVKGEAKNGKWRQVPLSREGREVFEKKLAETPRGGRPFIEPGEKTHEAINRLEKFLQNNRDKVETAEGRELRTWEKYGETHVNEMTFHGLRYAYIQDRMQEELEKGFNEEQAALTVSKEVGHERADVIEIYRGGS